MKYEDLDPILLPWAKGHQLRVGTRDRDWEIRAIDISSVKWLFFTERRAYQLWLDVEHDSDVIVVRACSYRKPKSILHFSKETTLSSLEETLDIAFAQIEEWKENGQ